MTMAAGAPEVRSFSDLEGLSSAAAERFLELAREALVERGRFVVALAGGRTPRPLYERLARDPAPDGVDWSRIELFFGDERVVPPHDPASNYGMVRAALLRAVPAVVHRVRGEVVDAYAAAAAYEGEIRSVLGPQPVFDLALLGIGADAHTASLFPGSEAPATGLVAAVEGAPDGRPRVTLTPSVLTRARELHFLVAGVDKAPALRAVLQDPDDRLRFPAQLWRDAAGEVCFFVDEAAAAEL